MQPDPMQPQDPQAEAPLSPMSPPEPKKKSGFNIQVVFLVLLILAAAGVGYWAMQANTALKAAESDLAGLNTRYKDLGAQRDSVSKELDKTTSELASTNAELETTKGEIATTEEAVAAAKDEVATANSELAALKKNMAKALVYVDIAAGIYGDDDLLETFIKVSASDDTRLNQLFNDLLSKPSDLTLINFWGYLVTTIVELLTQ